MKLYNQYFRLFAKSKVLFIISIIGLGVSIYDLINMYLQWSQLIVNPLETTLKLSNYIFPFFLLLSYEFFCKGKRANFEEVALTTMLGRKKKHYLMQYLVLCSVAAFYTVLLFFYNVVIFKTINNANGGTSAGFDYIRHIAICIFVYVFLISLLSINLGMLIHKIENRIVGIVLILLIVFISSPYIDRITNTLMDTMDINIFKVKNLFDIFPINLSFIPNASFGFSVLPYKVALILFWIGFSAALLALALKLKNKKIIATGMLAICLCSFIIYTLPASKLVMDNSPDGSAMHDMYYYEGRTDMKAEKADFKIIKYNLNFDIGIQLEAIGQLYLSDATLKSYKFTLYHAYKIESVKNQEGEELKFTQRGDYFEVIHGNAPTKSISVKYSGAAKAYYSNYQGIYLSGDFQYYPVAGYKKLGDPISGLLQRQFLDHESQFDVVVHTFKKVYSNLEEIEEGHFVGQANGLTLMAGMLTETKNGSNKIIWPTYEYYDEPGNDKYTLQLLEENGYKNCTFVVVPNMNQGGSFCNVSRGQIISTTPFFGGEGFRKDWEDLLLKGKLGDNK